MSLTQMFRYQGRLCFVAYEYANERVAIRFGVPARWQGEIVVDLKDLASA